MTTTDGKLEALAAMKQIAEKNGIFLTVTENEFGDCLAVSWQDEEHKFLDLLWEKK